MKKISKVYAVLGLLIIALAMLFVSCKEQRTETKLTVEQRMELRRQEIQKEQLNKIFYNLPESIVKAIYEKIGTDASNEEVVSEYLSHKEHYFDIEVAKQIGSIPKVKIGEDELESVGISTKIKDNTPKKDSVDVRAGDVAGALREKANNYDALLHKEE